MASKCIAGFGHLFKQCHMNRQRSGYTILNACKAFQKNPVSSLCTVKNHRNVENVFKHSYLKSSYQKHYSNYSTLRCRTVLLPSGIRNGCKKKCLKREITCMYFIPERYMAGHSHYQNIKDIKEKKDKERGDKNSLFQKRLAGAIRQGGSADPTKNSTLDKLIKEGRKQQIPNTVIERTLKKEAMKAKKGGNDEIYFEFTAPGGVMLIVAAATDNKQRAKVQLQTAIRKFPEIVKGNVKNSFEHQGIITVSLDKDENVDMDKYTEVAIEAGAEDVVLEKDDDDGSQFLKFTCNAAHLHAVRREVESRDLQVMSADAVFFPLFPVEVDEEQMEVLQKVNKKLLEVEDVSEVFMNVTLTDNFKSPAGADLDGGAPRTRPSKMPKPMSQCDGNSLF